MVAVKLNCLIRNELEYPVHDIIYWTDSTVVLQYIRNKSRRFHTFVANRVAMIHDESTPCQWRHVDTFVNPADIASKGAKGSELHKLELWLHGPKFLWKDEKHWPEQPPQLPELSQDDSECRKYALVVQTQLVAVKSWNRCCAAIHPGAVFERPWPG